MTDLDASLKAASPRLTPRPVSLGSQAIYVVIFTLWLVLLTQGFLRTGLLAWSVGIAYIGYDTFLLCFVASRTLPLRHLTPAPPGLPGASGRPSLGVVVASYNEAAALPRTLAALAAQTDRPDLIMIADDGSTDGTESWLLTERGFEPPVPGLVSRGSDPGLVWLRVPHGGKARALNAALLHLETDLVLTIDADTLLEPDAIAAVRRAFAAEPGLVAITGVLAPVCGRTWRGRAFEWFQTYEYIRNFISRYAWMREHSLLLISGAFAGFRLGALTTVGGFDPECFVEDYELIHRLHRYSVEHGLAWRVRVLGDARAVTDAPDRVVPFLRQRRRWFAGFLQTQFWNRDMTGNARFGRLGLWMMPVKAIDTLQPIYGLSAFILLLGFLATGEIATALPVFGVMGAKIGIDLGFHLWSVELYRRWTGDRLRARLGPALLAAIAEPFSFQLLRHTGAAWGWIAFLTRSRHWGTQNREGLLARSPLTRASRDRQELAPDQ